MTNLNELPLLIKEYGAKALFEPGQIVVLDDKKGIYADVRTTFDIKENVHDVYAVAYDTDYYEYVCPSCGSIHGIHKTNTSRKLHSPSCGIFKGKYGKRCIAYINDKGDLVKLPVMKFRFHKHWKAGDR